MEKTYVNINGAWHIQINENGKTYKYLMVSDQFRTNGLSLTEGGYDVAVFQTGKPAYAYTNIKSVWAYTEACKRDNPYFKSCINLGKTKTTNIQ